MEKIKDSKLDPNSMDYVPPMEEALPKELIRKLETEWEDPIKSAENDRQYDLYIERWQIKHREKLRLKLLEKKEKKGRKLITHWFNTLHEAEIKELIESSRSIVEEVFSQLIPNSTKQWESDYMIKLKMRVKNGFITISNASDDKLRRFPKYNATRKSLDGSPHSFYRLWAHVFKSEERSLRSLTTVPKE